uniref:Sulfotransferase domain-containing protein n=1 Tax=Phaeocystis antarctica TaxID=33657 RepID=A0A7S0NE31_9EUKA|mmetsp:Transcript_5379/g.12460  ORF Transcript_5379/g.12460 Transcript_5379/m.12460 type:complete len:236 (+) Transcript_5379:127-834(+)
MLKVLLVLGLQLSAAEVSRANSSTTPTSRPLIIVLGMPKTGTETIGEFFKCNGLKSAHWKCDHSTCGDCVMRWVTEMSGSSTSDGSAALRSACGDYDVFAQMDYEPRGACLFPQMYFLQTLLRYLPSACFILNTRPTEHWLASVRNWKTGRNNMLSRLTSACPINPRNATGLGEWYERFKARASLALRASTRCGLEFDLEDGVGPTSHLDQFFALNSSTTCLGIHTHETSPNRMA